jgi:uncharacterized protein YbcC (UPF0753/DUF2309 family)
MLFLELLISAAAATQQATSTQLLNDAERAYQLGDEATARRKLNQAQPIINQHTEALRSRLAAHVVWDECVKTNASRVALQNEKADVLADAVLGICLEQETTVRTRQTDVDRYVDNLEGAALNEQVDKDIAKWRDIQRQTALGIIVNARSGQTP